MKKGSVMQSDGRKADGRMGLRGRTVRQNRSAVECAKILSETIKRDIENMDIDTLHLILNFLRQGTVLIQMKILGKAKSG